MFLDSSARPDVFQVILKELSVQSHTIRRHPKEQCIPVARILVVLFGNLNMNFNKKTVRVTILKNSNMLTHSLE